MTKKVAIVALIVLIILLAIPLGIGMAMGVCPDCTTGGAPMAIGMCLTLVSGFVLLLLATTLPVRVRPTTARVLLLTRSLERPPRAR